MLTENVFPKVANWIRYTANSKEKKLFRVVLTSLHMHIKKFSLTSTDSYGLVPSGVTDRSLRKTALQATLGNNSFLS